VLKSYDEYLRFVFLTGLRPLNHLTDLTLDPNYAAICGITQEELETCFALEIESVSKETGRGRGEYQGIPAAVGRKRQKAVQGGRFV